MKNYLEIILILLISLVFSQESFASKKIVLGVYQYQSKASVEKQYQGFADYLNKSIPNYEIELKVYTQQELLTALQNKQIQLLLVNPNLYEILRTKVELNGITATQQILYKARALDHLGGVIFTKSHNTHINQLSDLETQRIAIPSKSNTGAYRIPLYELYKAKINYKKIHFLSVGDNDSVIETVLSDKADVGFVRTGILEKWLASHRLKRDEIKIINPQSKNHFPHFLSTELIPEWPFIILPGLDENLNRDIAVALFALRSDNPAAKQAGIAGFVAPRDYLPFENMLRALKLEPYDAEPEISLSALWKQYRNTILLFAFLLIFIVSLLILTEKRKILISRQEQRLKKQNKIDEILLELPKYAENHTESELLQYALDQLEQLTLSSVSFIYSVDNIKQEIQLIALSHNALKQANNVDLYKKSYPIQEFGIFSEMMANKTAVIMNNFLEHKHSPHVPDCHSVFNRMAVLPVIEHNQITLIACLGNRESDYQIEDINVVQLVLNEIWRVIKGNRTNQEIIVQKNTYQQLLDDLGEKYMVFSHSGLDGILTYVSAGFSNIFEQPVEQILNLPWFSKIDWHPDSIVTATKSVNSIVLRQKSEDNITLSFYTPENKTKTILVHQHAVYEDDTLMSIDGLITDITEQIEAENRIKQAASVFESANEGILVCNENNLILRANKQVEQITGYSESELIGKNPNILSSDRQDKTFYTNLWQSLLQNGSWEGELWNRRKNGDLYPQQLKITTILDHNKKPAYFIGLLSDITDEKEHQKQLEKMAHFDALTSLPNRFLLSDRITQAIHALQRNEEMIAIMFIDLDGFKLINDTYGHQAGDVLLKTLAKRLLNSVRDTDTVARIGGDEFVVVISGTKDPHEFTTIEQRILKETSTPVDYENHKLQVSSSIGVVYYGHNYGKDEGSEQLLRLADQAMYTAKQRGKNKIQHYAWDNIKNKSELVNAFKNGLFELYYQPKVNCKTGEVTSLEGLIRLNHPVKGVLSPIEFLTDIEQFDLMDQLSKFVILEGVQYLESLNHNRQNKIGISLNIQGNSLLHKEFVDELVTLFKNNPKISPEQMTLEILESASLGKVEKIAKQINLLKAEGFRFSIDDFGTGYASLTYLKNLPVNEVKIDQEFIREMFSETNSLSIIEAIKSMAEAFNLSIIAEGAETNEHIELLLQLGIESVQGYAIAKPMPQSEMNRWLKTWQTNPYWQTLTEISAAEKRLLKARLAHISWINKFDKLLAQEKEAITISSYLNCEFGLWLINEGKQILNDKNYQKIDFLHQEIHRIGNLIIESKSLENENETSKLLALFKINSLKLDSLLKTIQNEL
ncbi:EAL domain-containing protein [Thiomicrorhabdus hydrogeniphila]